MADDEDEDDNDRTTAVETKDSMTALLRSQGWDTVKAVMHKQVELLNNQVLLKPLENDAGVYSQEFNKGQAAGLRIALNLPQSILDGAVETMNLLSQDEDDDNA